MPNKMPGVFEAGPGAAGDDDGVGRPGDDVAEDAGGSGGAER
ncbi:hypothetical protein [Arthrobacter jiangjiafuii]|nr:hypothetical protein [Arthrobacter jiangjiafuii]